MPQDQNDQAPQFSQLAATLADEAIEAIAAAPNDLAAHEQALYDLNISILRKAAASAQLNDATDLVLAFAQELPEFDTSSLYRTRASIVSLAAAVFTGWFAGGLVSSLLGILSLGGDVYRPLFVLGALWLEDYFAANPSARKILLTALGLGALGRLAAALANGLMRFTSLGSIRNLIFGAGAKFNIFKSIWLWLGAIFVLVFFARKLSGLDIAAFKSHLTTQVTQRLRLYYFFFSEIALREDKIERLEAHAKGSGGKEPMPALARAIMGMLDTFDAPTRQYLQSCLAQDGFDTMQAPNDTLIWQEDTHPAEYDALGLVKNGDVCKILRSPYRVGDKLVKGLVQRKTA